MGSYQRLVSRSRGRTVTAGRRGIRNARVTMTMPDGTTHTAISGTFGYFSFTVVAAGETYVFSVRSKRFTFSQPTQVRSILKDTDDIIFTANNENQIPAMSTADSPQP